MVITRGILSGYHRGMVGGYHTRNMVVIMQGIYLVIKGGIKERIYCLSYKGIYWLSYKGIYWLSYIGIYGCLSYIGIYSGHPTRNTACCCYIRDAKWLPYEVCVVIIQEYGGHQTGIWWLSCKRYSVS